MTFPLDPAAGFTGQDVADAINVGQGGVTKLDLVGHSLAAGGGGYGGNFGQGWIAKLVAQLGYPHLRDGSKGGSCATVNEGGRVYVGAAQQWSGAVRTLSDWPGQGPGAYAPLWPYLPLSQLAIAWHYTNDVGYLGPNGMACIEEACRAEIARFRVAHLFEDNAPAINGLTPITYSAGWRAYAGVGGFSSGSNWHDILGPAYDGVTNFTKITCQVPPDLSMQGGTLQFGFMVGSPNKNSSVWELHDVTSGDTLLATWDLTTIPIAYAAGSGNGATDGTAVAQTLPVVRRYTLPAGPTAHVVGTGQWTTNGTITVDSTAGFASAGVLRYGPVWISYTGLTATTFTGCAIAPGFYGLPMQVGDPIYGSRQLELRPTVINTLATGATAGGAMFDFWAIEATNPGIVVVPEMYYPYSYALWAGWPYGPTSGTISSSNGSNQVTLNTATLTNAMAATGDIGAVTGGAPFPSYGLVRIDNEIISSINNTPTSMSANTRGAVGSTAATHAAGATILPYVRAGDSFTIGTGASKETLTVQSVAGATITFTTNMQHAHGAGDPWNAGYQNADVDLLNAATRSVVAEFTDGRVISVPMTDLTSTGGVVDPLKFIGDGVHPHDGLHGDIAKRMFQYVKPLLSLDIATHSSPMDFGPWFDSAYQMFTLNTHWTSYSGNATWGNGGTYSPRLRKDMATGMVQMEGAVICDSAANMYLPIFNLPVGARPAFDITRVVTSANGPAVLSIKANGDVAIMQGGAINYQELNCSFFAEA